MLTHIVQKIEETMLKNTKYPTETQYQPGTQVEPKQFYEKWGIDFAPVVLNWVDGSESTGVFSLNLPRICENVS